MLAVCRICDNKSKPRFPRQLWVFYEIAPILALMVLSIANCMVDNLSAHDVMSRPDRSALGSYHGIVLPYFRRTESAISALGQGTIFAPTSSIR